METFEKIVQKCPEKWKDSRWNENKSLNEFLTKKKIKMDYLSLNEFLLKNDENSQTDSLNPGHHDGFFWVISGRTSDTEISDDYLREIWWGIRGGIPEGISVRVLRKISDLKGIVKTQLK